MRPDCCRTVGREHEAPPSPARPTATAPDRAPVPRVLALQRLIGDHAVTALLARAMLQRQVG